MKSLKLTEATRPGSPARVAVWTIGAILSGLILTACEKPLAPKPPVPAAVAAVPGGLAANAPGMTSGPERLPSVASASIELMHVHGLSYTQDGTLYVPSHHGLARFDGTSWSRAPGPLHDYMGFASTKDALYSSGHPAPNAGMVNPFGLIKSIDTGQTWKKLGLEGESDFHLLAVGYESNAIYVVNTHPNSKMKTPGLYATLNDGFSWQAAATKGLSGNPGSIAVHPTEPGILALGTERGLYFSRDAGATFQRLAEGHVAAVQFDLSRRHLWYAAVESTPVLTRIAFAGTEVKKIALPAMQDDAVIYIAQNPARRNEYAFATARRNVYWGAPALGRPDSYTPDANEAERVWKPIAIKGSTR